jgi:hypothetical protein
MVLNTARVEAQPLNFGARSLIVVGVNRVVKQELRPSLRRVDLHRQCRQ